MAPLTVVDILETTVILVKTKMAKNGKL